MKSLTEVDGKGNWHIAGIEWGNVKGNLYGALCKLKDYEDTGLSPAEVAELNTFDGSQAIKATAKLQEEQRKHRWVPVSERLPDDGQTVLVSNGQYVYLVEYDADLDAPFGDMDGITAWMPLPEPYKAD